MQIPLLFILLEEVISMQKRAEKTTSYETPRLQTYGKLRDLTKGGSGSLPDAGTYKTEPGL